MNEGTENGIREDNIFVWHNNFLANIDNAYDDAATNEWDNGPAYGGNYWSDHVCHGNPSDGSEPYEIDADSVDHYQFENVSGWTLIPTPTGSFDTGSGGYPRIMGNHTGSYPHYDRIPAIRLWA